MRDGLIDGIDLETVRADTQALFAKMRAAYPRRAYRQSTVDELFPPVFPVREQV